MKKADYKEKECVRLVFLLHKETMEENYSLDKIIEECFVEESEEKVTCWHVRSNRTNRKN